MDTLSERLKALGVKVGARDLPPPRPRDPYPIQGVVPGRFQETPHGEVFLVERRYPVAHQHGSASLSITAPLGPTAPLDPNPSLGRNASLGPNVSLGIVAEWAREPRLAEVKPDTFAFLDTETTGLAGGTGTYAFLVGVGRYDGEDFHLAQFFMRDPAEEPALLWALTDFLGPCQALVTFNGKAFDVPLLNARYITNGETPSLTSTAHLDLLPLARRLWRDRLPSRALGYLEEHILGLTRSQEDVPGWVIPSLYFDYLRGGDARPLKSVFYHNAIDILSLAALLGHVADLLGAAFGPEGALRETVVHGLDLVAMGKLFEDLRRLETAARLYEHGLAGDLPGETYWEAVRRLSFLHKRRGDLSAAVSLWRQAAGEGQVYAHVELAKYYEHRARDYREAAGWTQAAIALVEAPAFPGRARQRWLAELEHRLARLRRKLDGL
jgi:uncharacterized protein YprB with RNaseH-like and TPR domain